MPEPTITALHHITCIAGDAQENFDFYTGTMGMRLVKRSVNQDAPGTYHLFYADGEAHPGTDLTFFPWPEMEPGRRGAGLTVEIALAVPPGTLEWWADRLHASGVRHGAPETRFGERVLPFEDPHGLAVVLVESADEREFTPWTKGPVPPSHQVRRLHGARLLERDMAPTVRFLTEAFGFQKLGEEDGWHRYALAGGGSGRVVDIKEVPGAERGTWGTGSVHHIAWRVPDDETQVRAQELVHAAGRHPTEVIDRFWFRSVYFKEPGGALFEIATDGPGFDVDEPLDALGTTLVLPPWLEPHRARIEAVLPELRVMDVEDVRSEQ